MPGPHLRVSSCIIPLQGNECTEGASSIVCASSRQNFTERRSRDWHQQKHRAAQQLLAEIFVTCSDLLCRRARRANYVDLSGADSQPAHDSQHTCPEAVQVRATTRVWVCLCVGVSVSVSVSVCVQGSRKCRRLSNSRRLLMAPSK